jgi:lipid-binding SYLF domain-containing protein
MSSVKNIRFAAFSIPTLIAFAVVCALAMSPPDDDKAKEQDEIRTVAQKTLQQLYKAQPAAQSALEHAAGYAVFSNMGIKILFAGSGKGKGIAVDNQTKRKSS